jgi:hypothetical protein
MSVTENSNTVHEIRFHYLSLQAIHTRVFVKNNSYFYVKFNPNTIIRRTNAQIENRLSSLLKQKLIFFKEKFLIFDESSSIISRQLCSECARSGYTKVAQNILQPKIVLLFIYYAIL